MSADATEEEAAQRARSALQALCTPPPVVLYPGTPFIFNPPSAVCDETAGLTSTNVHLISSPFPRRRATLALLPHDTTSTGRYDMSSEQRAQHDTGGFVPFQQPLPLVTRSLAEESRRAGKKEADAGEAEASAAQTAELARRNPTSAITRIVPRSSTGPYAQLSYIFDISCCPFTALFATMRANGFTRVEGRKANLHKSHSLLWVKHLTPATVDKMTAQLPHYRKVNHFPGSHWLGRKDKLCLLLRRAGLRWRGTAAGVAATANRQRLGRLSSSSELPSSPPHDSCPAAAAAGGDAEESSKAGDVQEKDVDWESLTPATWLLPQDADAFRAALRQPTPSLIHAESATDRLFIVKPANNAGGQGIFLVDAKERPNGGDGGVAAVEAALRKVGALPEKGLPAALSSAARRVSDACNRWTMTEAPAGNTTPDSGCFVVQRYLSNPVLVLGHKFDLRLYVVVTSYEPVRCYLYGEGLVRIASAPYRTASPGDGKAAAEPLADLQQLRAHLTNFTVNKVRGGSDTQSTSDEAEAEKDTAKAGSTMESKWSLEALGLYLRAMGYDWAATQRRVHELLRRVFLSVTPEVRAELSAATSRAAGQPGGAAEPAATGQTLAPPPPPCTAHGIGPFFQLFGVDVLLVHDEAPALLRPVLLEVNILPSLSTHYSVFDQRVKANFIADALTLVGLTSPLFKAMPPRSLTTAADTATGEDGTSPVSEWIARTFPGDVSAQEACFTAAEEHRRSANFTPLLPTADSAQRYAALMVDEALGVARQSRYDAVLSAWVAAGRRS